MNGSAMSLTKVKSNITPPALWTHFPNPNPRRADDKHDLRQHQIAEAQLFLKDGALRHDALFGAQQLGCVVCLNAGHIFVFKVQSCRFKVQYSESPLNLKL